MAIVPFNSLKRCTSCILPETFPFIEFDDKGICNYCRNYKPINPKGRQALEYAVNPYRSRSQNPDCIVAISGGRDSSYGLHYVKSVLGMNPVAYSYDWGMVTDLARRNQARICGKLGVEHILVSADINKKRTNIAKNVLAWLKRPDLGLVPLFMAGDKQFFYYANKLRKQVGVKLVVFFTNRLETTAFKWGFCGIDAGSKIVYNISYINNIRLAFYYLKQFLMNPSYFNSSLFDTLSAFFSTYYIKHNYLLLYDYIKWDEQKIMSTLTQEYDWEIDTGTKVTWRIGDGTAAFYNYIYYVVAGFTENDTFRSNQVRDGMITREQALRLVEEENIPRYDAIENYFKVIGLNNYWQEAIRIINSIPKLYWH